MTTKEHDAIIVGAIVAGLAVARHRHGRIVLLDPFTFGLYWSSVYEHLAWKRSQLVASPTAVATPADAA